MCESYKIKCVNRETFVAWVVHRVLYLGWVRAGVCRPCDTIELTATSCNFSLCRRVEKVCVDRQLLRYS